MAPSKKSPLRTAKSAAKKTAPKKTAPKKTAPKKAVPKKAVPKKAAPPKATAAKKAVPKKAARPKPTLIKAAKNSAAKKSRATTSAATKSPVRTIVKTTDSENPAELFASLTEGERADSLRLLLEDNRLAAMAKVGRYRVIAIEPLALKSPDPLANCRVARLVIYDYSADRCVVASVDLDNHTVHHLSINRSQPMLAVEEEVAAMEIAVSDERVHSQLALGEGPQAVMHYWSLRPSDLSYSRRSAAVLLGERGARPSLVAVVDLLDACVTDVVPAELW